MSGDPIRAALERAARELERAGDELMMADCLNLGRRAKNEAHAVRAALAAPTPPADGEAKELAGNLESVAIYLLDICCNDYADYVNAAADYVDRAAALLRQLPPEGLEAIRYCVADDGAVIQRTSKAPESWAVHRGSYCMSHTGEWDIGPWPSERTDEWLSTHRWPTVAAAWEALQQARQEKNDD